MSTKIFNAYKINIPLHEFKSKFDSVKKEVCERYAYKVRDVITKVVNAYKSNQDDYRINSISQYKNNQSHHYDNESVISIANFLHIDLPTIVIYPHSTGLYCSILGVSETQYKSLYDLVQSMIKNGDITDYHYQNQTDPYIEGMTYEEAEEEYARRCEVWDEIMKVDVMGVPENCGFKYDLVDTWTLYELALYINMYI